MSKPTLSRLVRKYIRQRGIEIIDDDNRKIRVTASLKELTGIEEPFIYLVKNGEIEVDWWQLIGMISDKWKIQPAPTGGISMSDEESEDDA